MHRSLVLFIVGGAAMVLGTIDPILGAIGSMESSRLILPGSAAVVLGMFLGRKERRTLLYWVKSLGKSSH